MEYYKYASWQARQENINFLMTLYVLFLISAVHFLMERQLLKINPMEKCMRATTPSLFISSGTQYGTL